MKYKKFLMASGILFLMFCLFTGVVLFVDVQAIGPEGSSIGLATINKVFAERVGVHLMWYEITDFLGLVAIGVALGFASLGLIQLLARKSIKKVDPQIIVLGAFYSLVVFTYVFFEFVIVNYRPIILEGELEASYPSSHTILILCVMSTAMMMFDYLLSNKKILRWILNVAAIVVMAVTVVGRLICGIHWLTDIIAGILLSAALVMLFSAAIRFFQTDKKVPDRRK